MIEDDETAQRLDPWIPRLRCPRCKGRVERAVCGQEPVLRCMKCAGRYGIRHGIPGLLDPDDAEIQDQFRKQYDALRLQEGWASEAPEYYPALPFRDLTGRHAHEWRLRAKSFRFIKRWLDRTFGSRRLIILDAGAGSGWLSRLLAERHEVAAMDVNAGPHGLDAVPAEQRRFVAIQGDLGRMPLGNESCDIVIANASLHYTRTPLQHLHEAHRVLRPGGTLIIMDSPTYPTQEGVDRAHERTRVYYAQMGVPELAQHYGGLPESLFRKDIGFRFRCLRRDLTWTDLIKKRVREILGNSEGARFPIWMGKKQAVSSRPPQP